MHDTIACAWILLIPTKVLVDGRRDAARSERRVPPEPTLAASTADSGLPADTDQCDCLRAKLTLQGRRGFGIADSELEG